MAKHHQFAHHPPADEPREPEAARKRGVAAGAAAEPARATPAVASQATADKSAAQAPVAADNTIAWFGSIPASEVKEPGLAETLSKIKPALLNSGNPATGRRYLMMDRNTYMSQNPAN